MGPIALHFFRRLFTRGTLTIVEADGTRSVFGDGSGPPYLIRLHDERVLSDMMRWPELRFPELYMDGRWSFEGGPLAGFLTTVFELMRENETHSRWRSLVRYLMRPVHQHNNARAARRNASHHYDVGNDIYRLFLDEDWQYSCAYFPDPRVSLEEAQRAKKRHIAAKMLLDKGQRVLDIGCGWGGMALYIANYTGAEVTGITLADEQLRRARERAGGRPDVTFKLEDYRAIEGPFDRIVSVGMFEHVGVGYYDAYFNAVHRLLDDDGVMLLHSIGRIGRPGYTSPFIAKHIFPGGYIPSLSEVLPAIERAGLVVTDIEILRLHYAETLKAWLERFRANKAEVLRLKDERFFRMWEFYLAASEASFRSGDMMVFQIQLAKSLTAVPLTRDYMSDAEQTLAERDSARTGPALVARRG